MKIWVAIVLLVLIGGGYFLLNGPKTQPLVQSVTTTQNFPPTPAPETTPEITPAPTTAPVKKPPLEVPPPAITSGLTRGQLTCNYQIPADPNHQGIAELDANWNNLVTGKNGIATAAVCVSVNGKAPSLMSLINGTNGTTKVSAPWISLTADYTFLLYDQHGTDLPNCAGIQLSSCRLNTNK